MVHNKSGFRPPWPPTTREIGQQLEQLLSEQSWGVYEGQRLEQLQHVLAETFEQPHVYPCCSGTLGIELALRGLGVGAGDEVILSAYDFPGNFRAIEAVGARPVLVDLGPAGWAFEAQRVSEAASQETRAVIASHLHGSIIDMPRLMQLAADIGLQVIEDACQCPGAQVAGKPAGAWGDVSVLSFGGSKLLSSGRGGAVLTKHESVLQRLKIFAERGNLAFPLSELQAAVLLPQIDELADRHTRRVEAVRQLLAALEVYRDRLELTFLPTHDSPAYYKFPILLPANIDRQSALATFQAAGLPIDIGFRGFARRSARRCRPVGDLPRSKLAADQTVLLHHPVLLEGPDVINDLIRVFVDSLDRLFEHVD